MRIGHSLHEALTQEKELNDMKSRFVSMASHKFRTPLATILSSLSLIARYAENGEMEKGTKHIHRIKSSVNNMTDILNDFLSLSKLEEGKIAQEPVVFDLHQLVTEVCSEMQNIAKPGQLINMQYKGRKEVYLDKKIMRNICLNLLSNAIKFSDENKSIDLLFSNEHQMLKFTISDKEIGISKEDMEHLFRKISSR